LKSLFGIEISAATQYVLAFCVIFVLLGLFALILRSVAGNKISLPGQDRARTRQPRLGVVDIYDLDRQRQLVLVRRDNIEHLVMIGGPNDVVVETNIVKAQLRGASLPGVEIERNISAYGISTAETDTPILAPALPAAVGSGHVTTQPAAIPHISPPNTADFSSGHASSSFVPVRPENQAAPHSEPLSQPQRTLPTTAQNGDRQNGASTVSSGAPLYTPSVRRTPVTPSLSPALSPALSPVTETGKTTSLTSPAGASSQNLPTSQKQPDQASLPPAYGKNFPPERQEGRSQRPETSEQAAATGEVPAFLLRNPKSGLPTSPAVAPSGYPDSQASVEKIKPEPVSATVTETISARSPEPMLEDMARQLETLLSPSAESPAVSAAAAIPAAAHARTEAPAALKPSEPTTRINSVVAEASAPAAANSSTPVAPSSSNIVAKKPPQVPIKASNQPSAPHHNDQSTAQHDVRVPVDQPSDGASPSPAETSTDPFTIEAIEAEFARLLGRSST
jgi:flagellar protein FliO/FliZ